MQVKWGIDLSFTPFKPVPARLPPSCCVLWSQTCFPSPIYYNPSPHKIPSFSSKDAFLLKAMLFFPKKSFPPNFFSKYKKYSSAN